MIQEQFWLSNQMQPESPAYNIPSVFTISGPLDIHALEQSINRIIERHESFRTTFSTRQGKLKRTISLPTPQFLRVRQTDISHLSKEKRLNKQHQLITTEITRPFDLQTGPLIRSNIIQSSENECILLIVMHHIITDLASKELFAAELSVLYNATSTGLPLPELTAPIQYSNYVSWHEEWIRSQDAATMLEFWKGELRDQNPLLNLPLDYSRPPVITSQGKSQWFQLSNKQTTLLHEFSKQQSVALFIILLSSYIALLSRYCRQQNITIGVPLSNRRRENDKKVFGCFVNILPLTFQLSNEMSFTELLALVRKKLLLAHRNQETSFDEIVAALQPARDARYNPVFQAGFTLEPAMELQFDKLQIHSVQAHNQGAQLDLFLTFRKITSEVQGYFEYNQDLFAPETMERLSDHYQNFLSALIGAPNQALDKIEFLATEDKDKLLLQWNDTQKDYGPPLCLHTLFEQQVEKTPENIALITEKKQYTYEELNQKSNRVAHYLQEHDIGPDDIVAVFMERSAEMVIALYGISKAGAAYLPLEPDLPDQRLNFILSESKAKIILTQDLLLEILAAENTATTNPPSQVTTDNLAYIIYTSGSTGPPKGVMIEHKAIYNRLVWMQETFQLTPHDRVLQKTPFSFDVSVWEFFWPLFTGASLVVAPVNAHKDPIQLYEFIKSQNITTIHFVPSMLRLFLDTDKASECSSLQRVICSGEALSWELQNAFFEQCSCGLHNLYGPTEAAVDVSYWQCKKEQSNKKVPIGFPIANTQLYILDRHLRPVAQGTTGELYIGGIQVARGYLQRPELNEKTFLPDPFSKNKNAKLYKTGDLARHLPDGAIDYLGRIDFQVKLHGNRIELNEIEAVLNRHPLIKETVVTLHTAAHGKQHLVAYLLSDETDQNILQLRSHLANALPDYMTPGQFILLPKFPLTGSGKVNRKLLPDPGQHRADNAPFPKTDHNALTAQITERWKQILERTAISIHDNFFDIGGNSLLATQLTLNLEHDFQIEIPLVRIFQHPTIAAQSTYLKETLACPTTGKNESGTFKSSSKVRNNKPASLIQEQFWLINKLQPDNPAYNIPSLFHLKGQLNIQALTDSLKEIIQRHDILRTTFERKDNNLRQIVTQRAELSFQTIELQHFTKEEQQEQIRFHTQEQTTMPFDLTNGPLLRVTLLCLGKEENILLLMMHHIITDLHSKELFSSEISKLYNDFPLARHPASPPIPAPTQYKDFASWQHNWLKEDQYKTATTYWRNALKGYSGYLNLPTDHPRPPAQKLSGKAVPFQLSASFTKSLVKFSRTQNTNIFLTLLTAYYILLYRYTDQKDIITGVPFTNRRQKAHKDTMGCFVNILPIAVNTSPDQNFEEVLKNVRMAMLGAHRNQELPYELIISSLQVQRDISFNPLFQTGFTFEPPMDLHLDGLEVKSEKIHNQGTQLDIFFTLWEQEEEIHGFIEFNSSIFTQSTISRIIGNYKTLLQQIVEQPRQTINSLNILTEQEQHQQLIQWNQTATNLPKEALVHKLLEKQTEKTPNAIAAISKDTHLSYQQLNNRANQLARYLRSHKQIGNGSLVGVFMERSLDMLVTLYAILKAGGAYVPLDPAFPSDRISFMLEDTGLKLIVTDEKCASLLPRHDSEKIHIDSSWPTISKESQHNLQTELSENNLSYVIYTSGSTGKPKGVQVPHLAVVNFLLSMSLEPGITSKDTLLAVTTLSFDISVLELFLPLAVGGKTVIASREAASNGEQLLDLLCKSQATVMQAPPTTWYLLMAAGWKGSKEFKVLCGGEPLPREMARKLTQRSSNVWNMYGPTETTVWSTCHRVSATDKQILVGKPIANTQIHIVNQDMQPNPVGVAGEMLIGGAGVSHGYLNRPDLSRKTFIPNIFSNESAQQKLYKTGDLACYLPNGDIQMKGRIDNQIKLRGYRIELGEIEIVIAKHPAISQAVAMVREDIPGDKRLTAYTTPNKGQTCTDMGLRQYLRSKLPEYMVPAKFIQLKAMPLTLNGKIDRRALPQPEQTQTPQGHQFIVPHNQTEKSLSNLWCKTLQLDRVGIHDNFFDIGGNSLLSIQLVSLLEKKMGLHIPMVKFYQHPTVSSLADYLISKKHPQQQTGKTTTSHLPRNNGNQIAIIGMAGRFPGANTITQFWDNLSNGIESISTFSDKELLARGVPEDKVNNPQYVKAGTILDNAKMFDAGFFGYSRHEAEIMDPQQRVFLETAWEALESAGYPPGTCNETIGIFAGTSGNDYRKLLPANHKSVTSDIDSFELMMGNEPDFLTTRISYKLNLKGPSLTIQTACSTSLVAVHQACQHLLTHQCDMAMAGGVCIRFPQGHGYLYREGMIWSPDGHCRPFDAKAQGTIFGQGAGIVVLKRLAEAQKDNNTILAVINGSAINNDGAIKVGFTAPGVSGQTKVISTAMARSNTKADTIGYVEAHGTGTPLGDPIELEALTASFREQTDKKNYCAIGSVKSNIGHLDAAAGITGLIKTVLALQHKKIPATLHFNRSNPNIDMANSPFYVNNTLQDWPDNGQPRRAGVSSFGIGGTNAHVILEEAPHSTQQASLHTWHLLPLSAKSETALQAQVTNITKHLSKNTNLSLADIAWTLQQGRKHFSHRTTLTICDDKQQIPATAPEATSSAVDRDIIFMFSGQGSQYVNMGRDLYQQFPVFKKHIDLCAEILRPHLDLNLRDILFPTESKSKEATRKINQTYITQPALFSIEYSLAKLWNHFGIFPTALVGHSIGEYTAACIASVFSLEDALNLVAARGRLMQSLPPGSMLAVPLSEEGMQPYLDSKIALAVLNSANMSVVSGETKDIDNLSKTLADKGIEGRILHTSHAFHSPMMNPILEDFKKEVENTNMNPPRIPFVSNVTGTWITGEQVADPSYWTKHLRQTVNFFANAKELLTSYPQGIMLEVGPGQTLNILTKQHPSSTKQHTILASSRRPVERKNDIQYFLSNLGQLWENGCQPDFDKLYEGENRRRIPLPTYPFERKEYWPEKTKAVTPPSPTQAPNPDCIQEKSQQSVSAKGMEGRIAAIWNKHLVGIAKIRANDNFFDLGGDSLQAVQMFSELEKELGVQLPLSSIYENPVLCDFAKLVQSVRHQPVPETSSPATCAALPTDTTTKTLTPFQTLKKIIQLVGKPVSAFHFIKKLFLGTYCIIWYRLFSKNVRIKFPFFAHTKITIIGPGSVFIDSGCTTAINAIDHPTIVTLRPDAVITIGKKCSLAGMTIRCKNKITIGDRTWLPGALIQDFLFYSNPDMPLNDKTPKEMSVTIGNDVWLAMQSAVLLGGAMGDGSVLGVQAVLYNASVANHCFTYGNPIKKVVAITR